MRDDYHVPNTRPACERIPKFLTCITLGISALSPMLSFPVAWRQVPSAKYANA